MIRCSICKRFISWRTVTYLYNECTQEISEVKGKCSLCGNVEVEYDCYEDIVGWDELIESEKRERRGKNKK